MASSIMVVTMEDFHQEYQYICISTPFLDPSQFRAQKASLFMNLLLLILLNKFLGTQFLSEFDPEAIPLAYLLSFQIYIVSAVLVALGILFMAFHLYAKLCLHCSRTWNDCPFCLFQL